MEHLIVLCHHAFPIPQAHRCLILNQICISSYIILCNIIRRYIQINQSINQSKEPLDCQCPAAAAAAAVPVHIPHTTNTECSGALYTGGYTLTSGSGPRVRIAGNIYVTPYNVNMNQLVLLLFRWIAHFGQAFLLRENRTFYSRLIMSLCR